MIVISEYRLDNTEIQKYTTKGYRFAYGYEHPSIKPKESVGILLDTLYKSTIDLIERLLYFKHKVTLKFEDTTYHLSSLDDWKYTAQSDTDSLKTVTVKHPVLIEYQRRKNEYLEQRKVKSLEDQYTIIYKDHENIPDDETLTNFVSTFAYLYQLDVDYNNRIDLIKTYYQIKFYLDNDIPYCNEIHSIDILDEPMFNINQFKMPVYEPDIEIESFGNEVYLEDYIYKNSKIN